MPSKPLSACHVRRGWFYYVSQIHEEMKKNMKIAVLGGGGRTGQYLVSQLLEKGYDLKLLLRSGGPQFDSPRVEVTYGDAVELDSVRALVQGCQAVITTVGQRQGEPMVAARATANVLSAMNEFSVKRYVLLAGLNIDTPSDRKGVRTREATQWMKDSFPLIQEDRQQAYQALAQSTVHWTLVRVPFIEFRDAWAPLQISLEDCPGEKISAADIAAFMADQIEDQRYFGRSPFIAN